MRVVRGRQATPSGAARMMSTPRGKRAWFCFHCSTKWRGIGAGAIVAARLDAGAFEQQRCRPTARLVTCRISVVERSGYSCVPCAKAVERDQLGRVGDQREMRVGRRVGQRRAGVETEPGFDRRGRACKRRVEPERRVVVAERQRDGGRRSPTAAPAGGQRPARAAWCPAAPSRPSRRGTPSGRRTPDRRSRRRSIAVAMSISLLRAPW